MVLLVVLGIGIVALKVLAGGVPLAAVMPRNQYDVTVAMRFDGHGDDVRLSTFLPVSDSRQTIHEERIDDGTLSRTTQFERLNRVARWSGRPAHGDAKVVVRYSVVSRTTRFDIDPDLQVEDSYPSSIARYLRPDENVQVDHPEIVAMAANIGAEHGSALDRLRVIQDATAALGTRAFTGTTDALTALRLGEASCNGKSRLFVALARRVGIPARLVGGLVMTTGTKRTSHQWVEAYVAGHWVPFDPSNGHFATLPEHYLVLYRGDEPMFQHTSDIFFDYGFTVRQELVPSDEAKSVLGDFNVWASFERVGLPFSLLRTLLTLPVGALVVVLFKNVVGMPTWGTFLPALIAAAAGETGLAWGLLGLGIVVIVAMGLRMTLRGLQLLHSPMLAILLAGVSATLLGITLVADHLDLSRLSRASMFPIAVLAITAERFYLSFAEQGPRDALTHLLGTTTVIVACFLVMNTTALQVILIAFPETLLVVVAMDLYLGRWVGMRLSEYLRFRGLLGVTR